MFIRQKRSCANDNQRIHHAWKCRWNIWMNLYEYRNWERLLTFSKDVLSLYNKPSNPITPEIVHVIYEFIYYEYTNCVQPSDHFNEESNKFLIEFGQLQMWVWVNQQLYWIIQIVPLPRSVQKYCGDSIA